MLGIIPEAGNIAAFSFKTYCLVRKVNNEQRKQVKILTMKRPRQSRESSTGWMGGGEGPSAHRQADTLIRESMLQPADSC